MTVEDKKEMEEENNNSFAKIKKSPRTFPAFSLVFNLQILDINNSINRTG